MQKRGQAAMEFLMTYGWAILAAIIAIGALVYFGVFSPNRYVPETCLLSAPLGCSDDSTVISNAGTNSLVNLVIQGGGEDVYIQYINVTNCGNVNWSGTGLGLSSGSKVTVAVNCTAWGNSLTTNGQFRGSINIDYKTASGTRDLTSTGNIVRKVI